MQYRSILAGAVLAGTIALLAGPAAAQPRVVTSVLPLQSLAAGVMDGVGTPSVLLPAAASPHSYTLRPSEARLLGDADLILWIGADYETFLAKPIEALGRDARVLTLGTASGVTRLRAREGGAWTDHDHGHAHGSGGKNEPETDPHVFLDTVNAKTMVRQIAAALMQLDPANRARYERNEAATGARLDALESELAAQLSPVKSVPYVVFHDGYQYFEQRFGLNAVGSITVSPDRPPGARRLREMRRKIIQLNAACVFAEPQFDPALVRTVVEGTKARIGTLDYVGVGLAPGPDAYAEMMRGLARALVGCLRG
jgi:zinc transport system substrate-binding protein